jgi:hypothetical protein
MTCGIVSLRLCGAQLLHVFAVEAMRTVRILFRFIHGQQMLVAGLFLLHLVAVRRLLAVSIRIVQLHVMLLDGDGAALPMCY